MPSLAADAAWDVNLHGVLLVLFTASYAQRCAAGSAAWQAIDAVTFAAFVAGIGLGTAGAMVLDKRQWLTRAVLLVVRLVCAMFVWGFTSSAVLIEVDPERMWAGSSFAPAVIFSLLCVRVRNGALAAAGSILLFAGALVVLLLYVFFSSFSAADSDAAPPAAFACNSSATAFCFFVLAIGAFFGVSAVGNLHGCPRGEEERRYRRWRVAAMARCAVAWIAGSGMLLCVRASDWLFRVQRVNDDLGGTFGAFEYALLAIFAVASVAECCGVAHCLWETLHAHAVLLCGDEPKWAEKGVWSQRGSTVSARQLEMERRMRDFDARVRFAGVFEVTAMLVCAASFFALVAQSDRYGFEWLLYVVTAGAAAGLLGVFWQMRSEPEPHETSDGDIESVPRTGALWLRGRSAYRPLPEQRTRLHGFRP